MRRERQQQASKHPENSPLQSLEWGPPGFQHCSKPIGPGNRTIPYRPSVYVWETTWERQRCCLYLQGGAFVWGPLAGSLPLQAQLNEKLQQVDQQLVHHLLRLQVGCDVPQGVDHSQRAVSAQTRGLLALQTCGRASARRLGECESNPESGQSKERGQRSPCSNSNSMKIVFLVSLMDWISQSQQL